MRAASLTGLPDEEIPVAPVTLLSKTMTEPDLFGLVTFTRQLEIVLSDVV